MYYIAMDGGGTKLVGLLFDENLRLIASGFSQGTHRAIYSLEAVRDHIQDCYAQLFRDLPRPLHIETLYTICGNSQLYARLLPRGVTLGESRCLNEPVSGLYAGRGVHSGFVALSGTGSDVFLVKEDTLVDVIGGWGAILGDEGSGIWMGQQAFQAAIRHEHGWGEPTVFGEMVKERFGFRELREYVAYLYDSPAPFRRLGELLPLAAEAARLGDGAMEGVFRRGGQMMAAQMNSLLRRSPEEEPVITACGGAWKAHEAMAQAFLEEVRKEFPRAEFALPRFEHIMAGPIRLAMDQGRDLDRALALLEANFPKFIWNQGGTP